MTPKDEVQNPTLSKNSSKSKFLPSIRKIRIIGQDAYDSGIKHQVNESNQFTGVIKFKGEEVSTKVEDQLNKSVESKYETAKNTSKKRNISSSVNNQHDP